MRIAHSAAIAALLAAAVLAGCGDDSSSGGGDVEARSSDPVCDSGTVALPIERAEVVDDGAAVRAEWHGSGSTAVCVVRITGSGDDLAIEVEILDGPATMDFVRRCVTVELSEPVSATATVTPEDRQETEEDASASGDPIDPDGCSTLRAEA